MPALQHKDLTSEISETQLALMGFDVARLRFYRWLFEHGRNPDWVGVKGLGRTQIPATSLLGDPSKPTSPAES